MLENIPYTSRKQMPKTRFLKRSQKNEIELEAVSMEVESNTDICFCLVDIVCRGDGAELCKAI
jgi:hypothetical protein